MIQAVVFDCFGVLVGDAWPPFIAQHFADKPELYEVAVVAEKRVDAGLISYDHFIREVAGLACITPAQAHRDIERHTADKALFAYIHRALKPNYKLGLLSNAGTNWLHELFDAEQLGLFDATALSCETGYSKPDPRAYQNIADMLGVDPEACVFIDDLPGYCQGARDIGMQAIDYVGLQDTEDRLQTLLGTTIVSQLL